MPLVTIRHFTEADIPIRSELLRESRFQANLTDFAVSTGDDALTANQRKTIHSEHAVKRMFTMCGAKGAVIGFSWITSIDWRAQVCELSFGVLPHYRGGLGVVAVGAAHAYIRSELNMRVVINQVLDHNTMLASAEHLATNQRVSCAFDSYTVGEWRKALYWTTTEDDEREQRTQAADRRAAIADRIRAKAAMTS
ncbi:MAG TPA: GNAT family N-acetyltransferase [Actinokineospora sp.]|nr:GNAT family N-acetyltransferase [Actinokineospora sp.]